MCFPKKIEYDQQKVQKYHDPEEIRNLLEEVDTCKACPENEQAPSHTQSECGCRLYRQIYLKNLIEHVLMDKST